jgi:hypothetical protein
MRRRRQARGGGINPIVLAALMRGRGEEGAEDEEGGINPIVLATLMRRRRQARGGGISPLVLAALAH